MATQRTFTLSEKTAARISQLTRDAGDGGAGGSANTTRRGRGDRELIGLWGKIADFDDDGTGSNRFNYGIDIYPYFKAPTPMASGIRGRNTWEADNTPSSQALYDVVTGTGECGDIIGIEAIPQGAWVKILDVYYPDGDIALLFSVRNDPKFNDDPP